MIHFKRDFGARGWSVVGIYGVQPESRRYKLSNGGSLEPKGSQNKEKFAFENGLFFRRKIAVNGQSLGLIQQKNYHLSAFQRSIEWCLQILQEKHFLTFFEKNYLVLRVCRNGPTSRAVGQTQRPLKILIPRIYSSLGWTFQLP